MIVKPKDWTVDYFLKNESDCLGILEDSDALKEIPSLNTAPLHDFRDGQLVRFRGMLQDMHNPEYYFKSYEVIDKKTGEKSTRCGMYRDGASCEVHERVVLDSDNNENSERQTWFVISIPGLNNWAKEKCTKIIETNANSSNPVINDHKRSLDETEEEPMDCSEPIRKKEKVSKTDRDAGPSRFEEKSIPLTVSKDHILNFPIPNEDGKSCLVKIYKEFPYKLNEILNIVGFLSLDPNLSSVHDSEEMTDDLEKQTHHPPASIVPRLHAVKVVQEISANIPNEADILSKAEIIRGDLRVVLSQLLFGDDIAADYLICHLISSVYLRKDCLSLGAFSLNITNIPTGQEKFTEDFYDILKQIIAKSHFLDITLENLNNMSLLPKKDYDCDRLTSGILQLSHNTHLILDETKLTTGQLTACGTQNYKTMIDLIQYQRLAYDFKYYTMDYETDIPILILSHTKSFIPCQNQIAIKLDHETEKVYPQVLEAARQYLKDETRLNNIRQYISVLKNVKFELPAETASIIQEDFVRLRHANNKFTADNLHSLLVLARLMSISYGLNTLKPEMWKRSVDMEMERISRLSNQR